MVKRKQKNACTFENYYVNENSQKVCSVAVSRVRRGRRSALIRFFEKCNKWDRFVSSRAERYRAGTSCNAYDRLMLLLRHCYLCQRWKEAAWCVTRLIRVDYIKDTVIPLCCSFYAHFDNARLVSYDNCVNDVINLVEYTRLLDTDSIIHKYCCYLIQKHPHDCAGLVADFLSQPFIKHTISEFSSRHPQSDSTFLLNSLQLNILYLHWKNINGNFELFQDAEVEKYNKDADMMASIIVEAAYKILATFRHIGVLDNIILIAAEALEYQNDIEGLRSLLQNYLEERTDYVNAWRYMYFYNVKYNKEESMDTLKKFVTLDPSSRLVLDLHDQCIAAEDYKLATDILFEFLDYNEWKGSVSAWKRLCSLLLKLNVSYNEDLHECLKRNWEQRVSYWPEYHSIDPSQKRLNRRKCFVFVSFMGGSEFSLASECEDVIPSDKKSTAMNIYSTFFEYSSDDTKCKRKRKKLI